MSSKGNSIKLIEFKTQVLKSLVENYSGNNDTAIQIVTNYLNSIEIEDPKNMLDAWSVLTLYYFHKKKFKEIKSIYLNFKQTDFYYIELMGREWVIRKNLIEILLFIELEKFDLVDSKISSFFRVNKDYLDSHNRVKVFILLVKKIYNNPKSLNDVVFKQKLQTTLNRKPRKREDIFVLSFFAWLKAKIEKRDLYKVTLELVNNHN